MRILFIHEVNYLSKVIYEMHEFPELLALRGHDVTFLHYPEGGGRSSRSTIATRTVIEGRAYPEARITLVTPPNAGGGRLERFATPILAIPTLRREIVAGNYDVIVLYAVPTTGWQTVAIARSAGVPVVFRALDASHAIRRSVLSPLIKSAERRVYRDATLLSANTQAMAEYCVALSGRTGPTIVNLPPLDLEHFVVADRHPLRSELGLTPADRVLLYMGTFFRFSGLDAVIDNFPRLLAADPRLRLVLVGGGEMDDELRAQVKRLGLEQSVIFTGFVPYDALPRYLAMADIGINPFRPSLLANVALPHKVLQYMAAGVPVVATSLKGLRWAVGEDSGVTWVDSSDDVARAAAELAAQPSEARTEISRRQNERVRSRFGKSTVTDSFEAALRSVD